MPVTFVTPSQLLADRVIDAQGGQVYVQPPVHALPGALRAIKDEELAVHHEAGTLSHEIVETVNAQWREDSATRLGQFAEWVGGTYLRDLERRRQIATEMAADEMRKRAIVEKLIVDNEVG